MAQRTGLFRYGASPLISWGVLALIVIASVAPWPGSDDDQLASVPAAAQPVVRPPGAFPSRNHTPLTLADVPSGVRFLYQPEVDEPARRAIENAIAFSARYFEATAGIELDDLLVIAGLDDEWLIDQQLVAYGADGPSRASLVQRWNASGGMTLGPVVAIRVYSYDPDDDYSQSMWEYMGWIQESLAHELVHVLQYRVGAPNANRNAFYAIEVPRWIIEGQAELVASELLDAFGIETFESRRATAVAQARLSNLSLDDAADAPVTTDGEGLSPYFLGFLAMDFAVGTRDVAVIWDYWRAIGAGARPDQAFERTFGMSTKAFVPAFDTYRAANFAPYTGFIEGRVTGGEGTWITACSVHEDHADSMSDRYRGDPFWGCFEVDLSTDGRFRLRVPPGRYRVYTAAHDVDALKTQHYRAGQPGSRDYEDFTPVEVGHEPVVIEFVLSPPAGAAPVP